MKNTYLNVGLPEDLANELAKAVEEGIGSSKTDIIRKAISNEIENINKVPVGCGMFHQDQFGRIFGFNRRMMLFALEHFGFLKRSL